MPYITVEWKDYLNSLVYAYNCTPHDGTSYTPYELMFGRLPQIGIDTELALLNGGEASHSKFCQDIRERSEYCHASAKTSMQSAAKQEKPN